MNNEEIEVRMARLPDEYWATKRYLRGFIKTSKTHKSEEVDLDTDRDISSVANILAQTCFSAEELEQNLRQLYESEDLKKSGRSTK